MTARELRDLIGQSSTGTRRRRFAPEVKREVIAFAMERNAAGESWPSLGRQLGIDVGQLRSWCRASPLPESTVLQPVEVVAPSQPVSVRLVAPSGVQIEGLSVQSAAELLRLLG